MDFVVTTLLWKDVLWENQKKITLTPQASEMGGGVTSFVQVFLYLHECRGKTHYLLIGWPSACHHAWVKVSLTFQLSYPSLTCNYSHVVLYIIFLSSQPFLELRFTFTASKIWWYIIITIIIKLYNRSLWCQFQFLISKTTNYGFSYVSGNRLFRLDMYFKYQNLC